MPPRQRTQYAAYCNDLQREKNTLAIIKDGNLYRKIGGKLIPEKEFQKTITKYPLCKDN